MKIVVASPLYPPDIATPAPYVKELARRLSKDHNVSILTYGRLPEVLSGVSITAIDKRTAALKRLAKFTYQLWQQAKHGDVVLVENGVSAELPMIVVSFLTKTPLLLHSNDEKALAQHQHNLLRRLIFQAAERRATTTITHESLPHPLPKPEINPLIGTDEVAKAAHETSWNDHLAAITNLFVPYESRY